MAVNYPNGIDAFNEPSLPEYTPLSSAGTGTRAHVEHHHDLGQAVVALQTHAAKRGHDHSGDANDTSKGAKLSQANTHENADTDTSGGIHHTLGTGANQAARGNHNHDYNTLTNIPWTVVASKPTSAADNTLVYEIGTNAFWVRRSGSWVLLPLGARPTCRLRQTTAQTISKTGDGTLLNWQEVLEDTFGYFSSGAPSAVTVSVPGLYHVEAAMQWDAAAVPDAGLVIIRLDNEETTIREQRALRGNGLVPGFSQTIGVSGYIRVANPGQVISVRVKTGGATILSSLLSLIDPASKVQSRIDVTYVSP